MASGVMSLFQDVEMKYLLQDLPAMPDQPALVLIRIFFARVTGR